MARQFEHYHANLARNVEAEAPAATV
jgi:hypothetical protein